MICEKTVKRYCCEDISNIENYAEAVEDIQNWNCHHRAEILPCGRYSVDELKKYGLYWNRPACELIFIQTSEHKKLHQKGKKMSPMSDEHRRKISESKKGHIVSEETKRKMSESHKGKLMPVEHRLKVSYNNRITKKGNTNTKGYIWINNGNCKRMIPKDSPIPEGFVKGRGQK